MLRDWIVDFAITGLSFYGLFMLMAAFADWRP